MGQARDTLDALKAAIPGAVRGGTITQRAADAFWDIVGGRPTAATPAAAPQDRAVTINVRVSGQATGMGYNGQVNDAVERALSGIAGQAGLTVTRGSVRVTGV